MCAFTCEYVFVCAGVCGAYVCCVQSFANMLRLDAASRESTQSVSHLPFNCAHLTQIDNCLGCHGRGTHEFITHTHTHLYQETHTFNYRCRRDRLTLPWSHTHTHTQLDTSLSWEILGMQKTNLIQWVFRF